MKDKTLISELEYMLDLDIIRNSELANLVTRAVAELKYLRKDIDRLSARISDLQWRISPDRMGS